jgi:hypothetical protein
MRGMKKSKDVTCHPPVTAMPDDELRCASHDVFTYSDATDHVPAQVAIGLPFLAILARRR